MKKLVFPLFVVIFLFFLSCEEDAKPKKCNVNFKGTKYSTNVVPCFDVGNGFIGGSTLNNGIEWNVSVDADNDYVSFNIETSNNGFPLIYESDNPTITVSGNTYTFSATVTEIDTQEVAEVDGKCTCTESI